MVVAQPYFFAFLLLILQLSVCYSKSILEDNRNKIQQICDKYKEESYNHFVKKVKEDVDQKLNNKVDVMVFNISDASPSGRGWDYKIGRKSGDESNGIVLGAGDIGVAIYLSEHGCKNESIFRYSITGDKQFRGPCQQLLEAMAIPNYIHGVCADFRRRPTHNLDSISHFSSADYCFKEDKGAYIFTKASTRSSCSEMVKVYVRQIDNCKN